MKKLVFIAFLLMQAVGVAEGLDPEAGQASGTEIIWECGPAGGGEIVTLTEARDPRATSVYEDEPLPTWDEMVAERETLTPEERERKIELSQRKALDIARVLAMRTGRVEMAGQTHVTSYNVSGNERSWVWADGGFFL